MKDDRRKFLRTIGGGSLFAAAGAPLTMGARDTHPAPIDEKWDTAWVERIQGKFRAVFDSPELSEGAGLFRAVLWSDQYKEVYGTARTEMSPVLVIRHSAIPLIMNDEYWKRYKVGKENKLKGMDGKKWVEVNPIRAAAAGSPLRWANYNLEHFMHEGGIVLACNLAFGDVVDTIATAEKIDESAARERAVAQVIPGIIMQPSGVFAVLRAQEAGCQYILAS